MSQIEFGHTRFTNLTEEQQVDLSRWRWNINGDTEGPTSLWIYGDRGSGTSYIGTCALHKMVVEHRDWDYEYHTATKLIEVMRRSWDINKQIPTDDPDLLYEYFAIEEDFQWLWEKAQVIFVDDLHASLDMGFWRKYLHQHLEERVKSGKVTILATTAAPNHSAFADITRVIENHFVVVHATR